MRKALPQAAAAAQQPDTGTSKARPTGAGLGRAVAEGLRFELLWKLIFLLLLNPLFGGVYRSFTASAGLRFNGGAVWAFLLSPLGVALFLALFFGAALLTFYEYSVLLRLAALCREGRAVRLGQVMRAALWDLPLLGGRPLALGAAYYVLLLPLQRVVYASTMVPRVSIPWFVFGEMQKSLPGLAAMVAVYIAVPLLHLLLIFVPVRMVLFQRRFGAAARESLACWKSLCWRGRLAVLALCLAWDRLFSELARYWRRSPLGSEDFNGEFLKNLLCSEAFRKDFAWWLLLAVLSAAAMAGSFWLLAVLAAGQGQPMWDAARPAWGPDGEAVWAVVSRRWAAFAGRWRQRMKLCRWRAGMGALCLVCAVGLLLGASQPLLVHPPLVIAHRGGDGGIENTLSAVLSAAGSGADYAEIDVQLTRDGVPVLCHDASLWRLAGRTDNVADLTWDELRQLSVSDNSHPGETAPFASLEQLLGALCAEPGCGLGLLIELKPAAGGGAALADAVIRLVEQYGFGGRAMFMSLDYLCLLPVLERHPEWWVGFCAFGAAGDIDDAVWRYQVDFLAVEEDMVNTRLVNRARELDLPVYVWSVYDEEKMQQYLEMGVTGLITDYPGSAAAVRAAYRAGHPGAEYLWQGGGLPDKEALALRFERR